MVFEECNFVVRELLRTNWQTMAELMKQEEVNKGQDASWLCYQVDYGRSFLTSRPLIRNCEHTR